MLDAELSPRLDGDPAAAATAAVRALGLSDGAAAGVALADGRDRLIRRRARVEGEVRALLAGLLEAADGSARPQLVSVADYEALLVATRRAYDKRRRADERTAALEAHSEWQQARLESIESSASWRFTEPLRTAKGKLRRGRNAR